MLLTSATVRVSAQDNSDPGPTCFDVSIRPENNPYYLENKDQYVVCKDQLVTITPTIDAPLKRTNLYEVEEIPFNPFPYTGTDIPFTNLVDYRADSDIDLPFDFCYFDETWNKISVHSNGYLSFTNGTNHKTQYPQGGNTPSFTLPANADGVTNTIMFWKHTHWMTGMQGAIRYAVYGEAPCRVVVITYFEQLAFQLDPNACLPALIPPQTHQIALYETTNFIDIIVTQHNGCPLTNDGNAILGINNANGTQAYTAPNKNLAIYDIVQQSWRFKPAGEQWYRMEWLVDGVLQSNQNAPFDVVIDKTKIITAKIIPFDCDGEDKDEDFDKYEVRFRPAIDLDEIELDRLIVCDKNQNTYNLNEIAQMVKDGQPNVDPAELDKLTFLYYPTEDDAINKTNRITNPREYPIQMGENELYVRVESEIANCFEIAKALIIKAPVEVKTPVDVNNCFGYELPVLTDDEFYYKLERLDEDGNFVVSTLPQPSEKQVIDVVGYYRVSIKKTNEYGCEDVKSFILFVESCSFPKGISPNGDGANDYLDLTYNNVQELKIYNRYGKLVYEHGKGYKRQWSGQDSSGKILPSGTYFMYVKTKDSEYQDWIQLMYEVK
ncbi:gliding motility-associated C-terminal domain-containing protein [Paenimyroides aestuarii]|uniref:Gliding motility-associated C-terminal domain-containing protein n=1 Tax=Paenimyroides aestuarii TaxID=2968490 RepID=A0ABY5NUI5_9FLAO|nr:gliding motility-associated C-terminal domain-containing protein [Paenimyroides aestuarii]UUV22252.1 gliding motility-associated C-terminal domain-containing protein [Paenimyroides aestuarii]